MKHILITVILLGVCFRSTSQINEESVEGSISYITSQNIYVRFATTSRIEIGDSLYIMKDGNIVPALSVINKSSISCVCSALEGYEPAVSHKVFTKPKKFIPPPLETFEDLPVPTPVEKPVIGSTGTTVEEKKKNTQSISGRFSVSSYSNFSNTLAGTSQRMRYTISINVRNISNSNFSAESYISFAHSNRNWDEIKDDIFNGLKIYSLACRYDFKGNATLLLGRKINPKMSSMGAIDGLQFEKRFKNISFGLMAGSRPDYSNYSYNPDLMQFGGYLSHDLKKGMGNMQTTLAIIDQENSWNTDRRFLYFQHYNSLLKNLYLFGSLELDLYQKVPEQKESTFNLTNFYILLRYKVIKQLSLSFSYSARNNVIYYETYKDIVERLLESTTLQGYMFQAQYRPLPKLSVGLKTGYRYRKEDPRPSKNADLCISYSQIPVLKIGATVSVTVLESGYLIGRIFTMGISRDLIAGKLYCGLNYRFVDYKFHGIESAFIQNLAEINLNWYVYKKLMLSVNYEGTFDNQYTNTRLYVNLTQRF